MNFPKRFLAFLLISGLAGALSALEISAGAELNATTGASADTTSSSKVFGEAIVGLSHEADGFRMDWRLGVNNEGEYPAPFMGSFYGAFTVDILEAGMAYSKGPFTLKLGKLEARDVEDSPYALFLSGLNHKAMQAQISYEDGRFFYSDTWIGLNRDSAAGLYRSAITTSGYSIYSDRGAVLKNYGLKFGRLRLGFQDAAIFTGSYFDLDFFANPAPSFFVQYVATAAGRPWSRSGDQNAVMGFFGDYSGDGWTVSGQVLVDDFNMNRFINPSSYQNPDKVALSAAGTWDSPIGKLGFFAAGATRYTFESIGGKFYSYTYYPGSAVDSNGSWVGIPLADQMLGYMYGENSLSAMATWEKVLGGVGVKGSLEFVLSGSKSPSNPWHEGEDWSTGTRWLDDPVLEKRFILGAEASYRLGALFLSGKAKIGWVQNQLALVAVTDSNSDGNLEGIWIPSSDSGLLGEISLMATYTFKP